MVVNSGWSRVNKRCFRVKDSDSGTFVLEGCDTSNTGFCPPGTGGGTVARVSEFVQLPTAMNINTSGGEPKKVNYKFLASDVEYNLNDGFSAVTISFELDADSIGSPDYELLKKLTDGQNDTVLKILLKNGVASYLPCTIALNEVPVIADGKIISNKVEASGNGRPTRYAAD